MFRKTLGEIDRRQLVTGSIALLSTTVIAANASTKPQREKASPKLPHTKPLKVAFLIDNGATIIDFCGPWEVFNDASIANVPGFDLFTVATSTKPIKTEGGMKIIPDYDIKSAPNPNIIVIPAQGGVKDPIKLAWLKSQFGKADLIMSVCTGAFVLANTGLLNGRDATTHHLFYDQFEKQFPKVRLIKESRYVDNGNIMSAGGLTSGIDGALHVVERFYGVDAAQKTAEYMEFHPRALRGI